MYDVSFINRLSPCLSRIIWILYVPQAEGFGLFLRLGREVTVEVLLHDECAEGHAIDIAEAAVLHVDGNGDAGIVHLLMPFARVDVVALDLVGGGGGSPDESFRKPDFRI